MTRLRCFVESERESRPPRRARMACAGVPKRRALRLRRGTALPDRASRDAAGAAAR